MRAVGAFRLAILSVLLMVAALLVYGFSGRSPEIVAKEPLCQAFAGIGGWCAAGNVPLDNHIVEALNLDDYIFQPFARGNELVTLYVGYYRSAKKVGAAHDPLVCFQGQGWRITDRKTGEYHLTRHSGLRISYSSMIVQRHEERQLIVYWFQADGEATASTPVQKVAMLWDKLLGKNEDNAFVRISAPISGESPEAVREELFDFIEDFYPGFYRYITRS